MNEAKFNKRIHIEMKCKTNQLPMSEKVRFIRDLHNNFRLSPRSSTGIFDSILVKILGIIGLLLPKPKIKWCDRNNERRGRARRPKEKGSDQGEEVCIHSGSSLADKINPLPLILFTSFTVVVMTFLYYTTFFVGFIVRVTQKLSSRTPSTLTVSRRPAAPEVVHNNK